MTDYKPGKYYTMFLGLLTMITALTISAVAIYYSVAGLVAIFAAAALPIMVMGGVLEVSKLVTAVWLHRYWSQATWWLKTYLTTAVIILMLITSMGIFGFLSKAHIEQTSASQESVAKVEQLEKEIGRQQALITRAEEQIKKLETSGTGNDANVQSQIDKEQERIDNAYSRIQPAIDEQQRIIDSQGQLYKDELKRVDEQLATLQGYIDAGDKESIKKAQAMIGARQDGAWGSKTAAAAEEWRKGRQQIRSELLAKIEQATNNPQAQAAANEIKRLRTTAETQIAESNKLINRLRTQIGQVDKAADIDSQVDEQNLRIKTANDEIDKLTEEKYTLEAEYRKLEAEVGPVKYIAEFVYGEEADTNLLEEAVRWVIVTIIFVFDPLAVLLLIASQYTFEWRSRKDDSGGWLRQYEQARAQRIIDNPGFTPSVPVPSDNIMEGKDELVQEKTSHEEPTENETPPLESDSGQVVAGDEEKSTTAEDLAKEYSELEEPQKKTIELSEDLEESSDKLTEEEIDALDDDPNWVEAKRRWKEDHPSETIKNYKTMYLKNIISKLPWESYLENPETISNSNNSKYIQNEEQNEQSIWNRISKSNE